MKLFKFFVSKIFLRRIILGISIILLICLSNYITFTAARTVFSTYQGSQETKELNQDGNYIANLDPNSTVDFGAIDADKTKNVYDYLSSNFDYAFYVDGFMVSIPNHDDMEISLCYMNEAYYELNQFNLSQGTDLTFDYRFDKNNEIPVLIGKGLSKTYPVGSTIDLEDPALGQKITLRVQGVLEQNAYHSNYYTLNSKSYYNFSIILPVNEEFLDHANLGLRVNGLMDIVILQTSEEKISDLRTVIQDTLGLKLNFFGQQDNNEYFNEYYFHSLKIVAVSKRKPRLRRILWKRKVPLVCSAVHIQLFRKLSMSSFLMYMLRPLRILVTIILRRTLLRAWLSTTIFSPIATTLPTLPAECC